MLLECDRLMSEMIMRTLMKKCESIFKSLGRNSKPIAKFVQVDTEVQNNYLVPLRLS